ncbi:hypothetical protein EVA_08399 [gut metagenome]|uniref:Uncharacterized protein n=1 Tax=gut metagenome TaxID=749906 RepID=J9CTE6_9ZZZZ
MGREGDVAPSTTTEIERLERKLEMRLQRRGVKPKEGSFANRALCQTLSKALEMSRATTKDSPKSLREEDQI